MGKIRIVGDTSGKEYQIVEATANQLKIRNVIDGTDILKADNTTISDAGGVALNSHASRHAYGGADALPSASVDRSQIKPLGYHFVKSASPTPGVSGAYGTAVAIAAQTNKSIVLLSASLTWGGTFGTGETVTIRLTAKFSDNTSANITKSATATGSLTLNPADLQELMKDEVYVTEVDVDSSSSAASTSVTTSATIYALSV